MFLTEVTKLLLPQLWKGAIVVLDHLKSCPYCRVCHRSGGSKGNLVSSLLSRLVTDGMVLVEAQTVVACHPAGSYEGLYQALTLAVNPITEDDAFGWFAHCGLFF